jgi:hypothetical protein
MSTAVVEAPQAPVEIVSTKHEMSVMDHTGDFKVLWDRHNPEEVEAARKTFNDLKKKGYAAFKLTGSDGRGEQVREFNPADERLVMVPALQGG